jgi:hypothetical protein
MLKNAFKHAGFWGFFFFLSTFNTYPLIFSLGSGTLNYTLYPWQHDWWFNSWLVFHGAEIIQRLASGSFFLNDVFYPLGTPISLYGQALCHVHRSTSLGIIPPPGCDEPVNPYLPECFRLYGFSIGKTSPEKGFIRPDYGLHFLLLPHYDRSGKEPSGSFEHDFRHAAVHSLFA